MMCGAYYRFDARPSFEDFAKAFEAQYGTIDGLDGLEGRGPNTIITFDPDFIVGAYVHRVAHTLGGTRLDFVTKEKRPQAPLPFTARPWRAYGSFARFALRFGFWKPS
jgi:hypothetical protein